MAKQKMVKCMATGQVGPRDEYYKAPNGRYFQSEAIYQAWMAGRRKKKAEMNQEKRFDKPGRTFESYRKICDTIADFIGYDPENGQPMPPIVFRKLKDLEWYSDEIIQQTLDENRTAIQWAMTNKKFDSDISKVSYMMAIVKNNIGSVYRREQDKANKSVKKESRPDFDMMTDLSNIGTVHKGNDVSNLLGGDDLWI